MRRSVLVLVMLFLSFQSVWSAAASLCAHEPSGAAHFGHHEHRHAAPQVQQDGDPGDGAGYHADCATCHGHCGSTAMAFVGWASAVIDGAAPAGHYLRHAPDRSPDNPLRPPSALLLA